MRACISRPDSATSRDVVEAGFRAAIDRAFDAPGSEHIVPGVPAAVTLVAIDYLSTLAGDSTCVTQHPSAPMDVLRTQAAQFVVELTELGGMRCAAALRRPLEAGQSWNIIVDQIERYVAAVRIRNIKIARPS